MFEIQISVFVNCEFHKPFFLSQFDNQQRQPASQSLLADQTLEGEEGERVVHLHHGPGTT